MRAEVEEETHKKAETCIVAAASGSVGRLKDKNCSGRAVADGFSPLNCMLLKAFLLPKF